jgi:hypothetical protein
MIYTTKDDPSDGYSNHWSNGENNSFDVSKLTDIEIDGIDTKDYPDFSDAFLSFAIYDDEGFSRPLTDDECIDITENNSDFIHEEVINQIF